MMRSSIRNELYKLRELVHFILQGAGSSLRNAQGALLCAFCKERLDEYGEDFEEHGNSYGPALTAKITIHHKNGDHSDNTPANKQLCHTSCHKGFHRRQANAERALRKAVTTPQGEVK